jgi:hypothetical protein
MRGSRYFMRQLLYIFILTIFFACDNTTKKNESEILFFYVGSNHNGSYKPDTLTSDKIERHDPRDTLIAYQDFEFNGIIHLIKVFTSDLHAPIDGGQLSYELDSLGIIYSRSTTWYSYRRLRSSNDSINSTIDAAIENILLYPKLSCYQYDLIFKETIKFVAPTTEENNP